MAVKRNKTEPSVTPDRWESLEGNGFCCRILVSPYNRRITVYDFHLAQAHDAQEMVRALGELAVTNDLDKLWLKCGMKWVVSLKEAGMRQEAFIPGYYKGKHTALVLASYFSKERETSSRKSSVPLSGPSTGIQSQRQLPAGVTLFTGRAEHCVDLARLYSRVFATYPFPVFDPDYLKYTMDHDVYYITAWSGQKLVAAASAEVNRPEKNAEVTDFATLPTWRGRGLAGCLLKQLEHRLAKEELQCMYTIARSGSAGMNKVFANAGYVFRGVLVNNCNIGGGFEDMNVWSKILTCMTS